MVIWRSWRSWRSIWRSWRSIWRIWDALGRLGDAQKWTRSKIQILINWVPKSGKMKLLHESEHDFKKYVWFSHVFFTPNFENRAHSHAIASFFRTLDLKLLKFAFLDMVIFELPAEPLGHPRPASKTLSEVKNKNCTFPFFNQTRKGKHAKKPPKPKTVRLFHESEHDSQN